MPINKELNEEELENVYGGPIKEEDLPSKFKTATINEMGEIIRDGKGPAIEDDSIPTFTPPDELDEKALEEILAGTYNSNDL